MKTRVLITALLFSLQGFAQRENNIWYFGNKVGIDFNSGVAVNSVNSRMYALEGSASISNASGQLLFYSHGQAVWNRNHQILPNGGYLDGNYSSTQSCLFIPKPGSNSIYYLFTTAGGSFGSLKFSEIDLSLNGGLGDITQNKNVPLFTPVCEKICAIRNTADDSYWLVVHGYGTNSFLTFKIDSQGVNPIPVTSSVGLVVQSNLNDNYSNAIGYMKFAPDGSKLVSVNCLDDVELFDFDITTGTLSHPVIINASTNWFCYGVEFSPSASVLYLTASSVRNTWGCDTVLQYDLTASDITNSETIIYTNPNSILGALQLAPDCKIYCSFRNSRDLYVVNNPDVMGTNCNFQSGITLSRTCTYGLPQSIQSSICKKRTIVNDDVCIGGSTSFSFEGEEHITTAVWNFGDGSTSNNIVGSHQYTAPGTYTVTGNFTTPTANFSISKQLVVPENPVAHPIPDVTFCGLSNSNYNLSLLESSILGNQSRDIYGVSFFASMSDAISHQNLLAPVQNFTAPGTTIYVKVYRFSNFDCYAITSFKVLFNAYPILNPVSEFKLCDDGQVNDGFVEFDLSTKTPELLGTQSASDVKVSYHFTLAEAQNNTHPITAPFTNTVNPQTIYARLSTLPSETCYVTTSFNLNVKASPEFEIQPFYVLCEDGNFENYVHVEVPNIFSDYLWSTGSQANFTNIAVVGNFWVKVTKIQSRLRCSRTKNFQVIPSNKAIIKEIIVHDWSANENSIQVLLDSASLGQYEYSIDGYNYQDSNYFEGLLPRKYTVYVREKNGCGITTDEVYLLMYPKFFTPNDDGYNDVWQVKFAETEAHFSVRIFDRYGRILSATNTWDGTYQGQPLSADDYWFIVERESGKQYKGHFTLKR